MGLEAINFLLNFGDVHKKPTIFDEQTSNVCIMVAEQISAKIDCTTALMPAYPTSLISTDDNTVRITAIKRNTAPTVDKTKRRQKKINTPKPQELYWLMISINLYLVLKDLIN